MDIFKSGEASECYKGFEGQVSMKKGGDISDRPSAFAIYFRIIDIILKTYLKLL